MLTKKSPIFFLFVTLLFFGCHQESIISPDKDQDQGATSFNFHKVTAEQLNQYWLSFDAVNLEFEGVLLLGTRNASIKSKPLYSHLKSVKVYGLASRSSEGSISIKYGNQQVSLNLRAHEEISGRGDSKPRPADYDPTTDMVVANFTSTEAPHEIEIIGTNTVVLYQIEIDAQDSGDSSPTEPEDNDPQEENKKYGYVWPELTPEGRVAVLGQPTDYSDTARFHVISVAYDLNSGHHISPRSYYQSAIGKSGKELRAALAKIISSEYHGVDYRTIWTLTKEADEDPLNTENVWLTYLEESRSKDEQQSSGSSVGKWNREHVWARSRGLGETSTIGPSTDGHNLRAEDSAENSRKSNRDFEEMADENATGVHGAYSYAPRTSGRGDIARMLMYMEVRWGISHGLFIDDQSANTSGVNRQGRLSHLLRWHEIDPVDPYEIRRNNVVYKFQKNRNPFVDHPELVDHLYGNKQDIPWDGGVSYMPEQNFARTNYRIAI